MDTDYESRRLAPDFILILHDFYYILLNRQPFDISKTQKNKDL